MLKVLTDYPSHDEELTVVSRSLLPVPVLNQVLGLDDLNALQARVSEVYVDPALISWVVSIANATRRPAEHGVGGVAPYISFGASPRGPISVVAAARAMALLRGRDYVIVPDIEAVLRDALRHRLVLSYQALAEEVTADSVLEEVLKTVTAPQIDLNRAPAAA